MKYAIKGRGMRELESCMYSLGIVEEAVNYIKEYTNTFIHRHGNPERKNFVFEAERNGSDEIVITIYSTESPLPRFKKIFYVTGDGNENPLGISGVEQIVKFSTKGYQI